MDRKVKRYLDKHAKDFWALEDTEKVYVLTSEELEKLAEAEDAKRQRKRKKRNSRQKTAHHSK